MKAFISRFFVFFLVSATPSVHAAPEAYISWATTHWGAATVGSTVLKPSHWGENADPDHDGIVNYATKIDPTRHNPSACQIERHGLSSRGLSNYQH